MYSRVEIKIASVPNDESRGNVWSGVVALVLLAIFTVALVASESDSAASMESGVTANMVIAGQ